MASGRRVRRRRPPHGQDHRIVPLPRLRRSGRGEIEIGWTFLERACWGGTYNGEMKQLMLDHAFRFVNRVVFLVGPQNVRSQRAVEKIGGVRDGMRSNAVGRESVVFLITRSGYEERARAFPSLASRMKARGSSRVLKAVPHDKASYRPHERSTCRPAISSGCSRAKLRDAYARSSRRGHVDFVMHSRALGSRRPSRRSREKNLTDLETRVAGRSTMRRGNGRRNSGSTATSCGKRALGDMLFGFLFDAIHHRGQLSSYLRPMGGKVPSKILTDRPRMIRERSFGFQAEGQPCQR